MNDLKNQVAFITEVLDDAFKDVGIRSIEGTLRLAQKQFNPLRAIKSTESGGEVGSGGKSNADIVGAH